MGGEKQREKKKRTGQQIILSEKVRTNSMVTRMK